MALDFMLSSSAQAIDVYNALSDDIHTVRTSHTSLTSLLTVAKKTLAEFGECLFSKYSYGQQGITVHLDKVMSAMLEYAPECGHNEGQHYVASAIVACQRRSLKIEERHGFLRGLGVTWLTSFLFTFRASCNYAAEDNQFTQLLLSRDGYQCSVSGVKDEKYPLALARNGLKLALEASHILGGGIVAFNDEYHDSESCNFAAVTFEVLKNFACIPDATLQDLKARLHSPSNGMILEANTHRELHSFSWCLKPTETPNVYILKVLERSTFLQALRKPWDAPVQFTNRSGTIRSDDVRHDYPLPDPHLLAIHSAIAEILHVSGAGKFFCDLLQRYSGHHGEEPNVCLWSELERMIDAEDIRNALILAFASVQQPIHTSPAPIAW